MKTISELQPELRLVYRDLAKMADRRSEIDAELTSTTLNRKTGGVK